MSGLYGLLDAAEWIQNYDVHLTDTNKDSGISISSMWSDLYTDGLEAYVRRAYQNRKVKIRTPIIVVIGAGDSFDNGLDVKAARGRAFCERPVSVVAVKGVREQVLADSEAARADDPEWADQLLQIAHDSYPDPDQLTNIHQYPILDETREVPAAEPAVA
jgi:hypothetical protein